MANVILILLASFAITQCDSGLENSTVVQECPNLKTSLSSIRKRRHLTFPDGSNFVITISMVKSFLTHVPSGWNTVIEVDVMFPLPEANFTNRSFRKILHHRQKRDVWERLRGAIEMQNINGRECILRSICEAKRDLAPPGISLVHDVLRAIFAAPIHDEEFTRELSDYYEEFKDPNFCETTRDCPFSLLHFLLLVNKDKY